MHVSKSELSGERIGSGYEAGEMYYIVPGHTFEVLEDARTVEFSPTDAYKAHMEKVAANILNARQNTGADPAGHSSHVRAPARPPHDQYDSADNGTRHQHDREGGQSGEQHRDE
jgi:hypothetical protein